MARTLADVAKRDPHDVLGVQRGAEPARIKAAWRRLARANHPDLTGDDPAASRVATRRMAEINDAYAALIREAARDQPSAEPADFGADGPRRGGPPAPRPTRPVTGRVDTTATFRPRNQTTNGAGSGSGAGSVAAGCESTGGRVRRGMPKPKYSNAARIGRPTPMSRRNVLVVRRSFSSDVASIAAFV